MRPFPDNQFQLFPYRFDGLMVAYLSNWSDFFNALLDCLGELDAGFDVVAYFVFVGETNLDLDKLENPFQILKGSLACAGF